MKSKVMGIAVMVIVSIITSPAIFAEQKEFKIGNSYTIKTLLQQHVGKRIILGLDSGKEISGIVTKVGDHVVQLSEPPRREFYDVIIRIDKITSLMIRVRGK